MLEESQPPVKEAEWLSAGARARRGCYRGGYDTPPVLFDVLLCPLIDWFDLLPTKIHTVGLGHSPDVEWGANCLG